MANPPTYPSDGRLTTLANFSGGFSGTELMEIVSPGNASLGVNYNITTQALANSLTPLSTAIVTVPQGGTNTSVLGTGLLLGNGTAAVSFVPATTANLLLTSQGSTLPPVWLPATTADFPAQNPNTVFAGPASGVATAAPAFRALVPLDLPGLVRNAVASSYMVATTDMGKLIGLGGSPSGLPFVLSLGTATGYTTSFVVTLYNESSSRGWAIAPNGVATFILWPLQTVQVFNDNNNWKLSPAKQPWVVPPNTTFNVDNVNGSDSSANDGIGAQGTNGAFATVQNAFNTVQRLTAQLGATLNIQLPPVTSTAITEQITVVGAMPEGVATLNLLGNTSTATNCQWQIGTGQIAVTQSDYQSITYNGIGFSSIGSGAVFVAADQYTIADFDNCDFGSNLNGVDIQATQGARVNIIVGNSISGQCGQFLQMTGRANVSLLAGIRVVGTSNVGVFLNATQGSLVNVTGLSFTGNTSGLSGQQFLAQDGGIIVGNSGVSWPAGMSAGTTASGGISDAGLTNSALAQMNASTIKGNNTNTTGGPFDLTGSQVAGITEQGMTLISVNNIATAVATYVDTTSISAAYDDYQLIIDDLIPSNNSANIEIVVHSNGTFSGSGYLNQSGGMTTYIDPLGNAGNLGTADGASLLFWFSAVNSTVHKKFNIIGTYITSAGVVAANGVRSAAWTGATTAVDGFALQMSTGTIASGALKVYGFRRAP